MKNLAAALSLTLSITIAASAMVPLNEYPARIQIVQWHRSRIDSSRRGMLGDTFGEGVANLIQLGKPTQGFQFTFQNCAHLNAPLKGFFPAKILDTNDIVILNKTGPAQAEECRLAGSLKDFLYVRQNGKVIHRPLGTPIQAPAAK